MPTQLNEAGNELERTKQMVTEKENEKSALASELEVSNSQLTEAQTRITSLEQEYHTLLDSSTSKIKEVRCGHKYFSDERNLSFNKTDGGEDYRS